MSKLGITKTVLVTEYAQALGGVDAKMQVRKGTPLYDFFDRTARHIVAIDEEKCLLKALLREAEPFLLDIVKQGGFHASEAGDIRSRICAALEGEAAPVPSIEDRILRLEALEGVAPAPDSWGITAERIRFIRDKRGASLEGARRLLVANFGRPLPEEQE